MLSGAISTRCVGVLRAKVYCLHIFSHYESIQMFKIGACFWMCTHSWTYIFTQNVAKTCREQLKRFEKDLMGFLQVCPFNHLELINVFNLVFLYLLTECSVIVTRALTIWIACVTNLLGTISNEAKLSTRAQPWFFCENLFYFRHDSLIMNK